MEALTGHAVVVEQRDELNYWNIPEEFSAAVCVPVSTMTMPLGTLWIYSTDARPFDDHETNLIEVIAGRIAVELEREVLVREASNRRGGSNLAGAIDWQQQIAPVTQPIADGWDFAASTSYKNSLNGDHCFWHSRGDGCVFSSVSSVVGEVPEIALTSALLAGTIRGLCESRLVADVVQGVNRTLWSGSDGDLLASIFASEVNPQTGQLKCVATGDVSVFVIRPPRLGRTHYRQYLLWLGRRTELRNGPTSARTGRHLVGSEQSTDAGSASCRQFIGATALGRIGASQHACF